MNKKIIHNIVILVALAVLAWAFFYFTKSNPTQDLIASGHPDWPPIMYQQDDLIVGAGPEIITKVFEELGIKVISKHVGSWDVVQEKAKSGEVDVLVAAYKTAERETYMDYSIPYTIDPVIFVTKKDKTFPYENWEDLITLKGVVMIGDSYGQEFDNFIIEKLTVEKVETPEEAFTLLEKEEIDYFVYALYSAENYIFENNISDKVEIAPKYITAEDFYLTISKKSPFIEFLPQVDVILKKYIDDGTIKEMIENHQ